MSVKITLADDVIANTVVEYKDNDDIIYSVSNINHTFRVYKNSKADRTKFVVIAIYNLRHVISIEGDNLQIKREEQGF